MPGRSFFTVVAVLATFSLSGEGQSTKECFVASADVNLRTAPPSGLFYKSGDKTGVVSKGDVLAVAHEKNVKTLFGEYKWVEAEVVDAKTQQPKGRGWIYMGKAGAESYFKPSPCVAQLSQPGGRKQ